MEIKILLFLKDGEENLPAGWRQNLLDGWKFSFHSSYKMGGYLPEGWK
jgi:hypothetical protein